MRTVDIVARWGGEEFLVALPDAAQRDALGVAERIREDLAAKPLETGAGSVSTTVTLGVAVYVPGQSLEECLARADTALYAGKRAGKNVVEAAA